MENEGVGAEGGESEGQTDDSAAAAAVLVAAVAIDILEGGGKAGSRRSKARAGGGTRRLLLGASRLSPTLPLSTLAPAAATPVPTPTIEVNEWTHFDTAARYAT